MKNHFRLAVPPMLLMLAACAAEYSKTEAPAQLRVDGAGSRFEVAFVGGSDRLSSSDVARLDRMVLAGNIRPSDLVEIGAAGPPGLAERRAQAISRELLRYGIVTHTLVLDAVPANHAIVSIGRYAVTFPDCPNWSQPPNADFTNAYSSYWGCSTATNLGLMVANPADLVSGRPFSGPVAQTASNAMQRYLTDRVKNPPNPTPSPFGGGGGGGGGEGGGGGGAGGAAGGAGP
jgi:pilus assembly protein CpaD